MSLRLPHMCKVFSCWKNTAVKIDSQVACELGTVGQEERAETEQNQRRFGLQIRLK